MRTPVFELHILPLVRAIDREHMISFFDLWNYEHLVEHADLILARVGTDMPPVAQGGPWPDEWVQLFRRWRDTGFKRLEVGAAQYSWSQSASANVIAAAGTFPAPGYRGWLHLESETTTERNYVLFFERPDSPQTGAGNPFTARERYPLTDMRSILVRDSAGVHTVH